MKISFFFSKILSHFILFYFIIIIFFSIFFCNEQCSFSDSGTVLSQTGSKTESECTKHPTWPNWAHPGMHRLAQARTVAVSWHLARPCRGQGRPCRRPQAAVSQPPLTRPCAVLRAMLCRAPTQRPAFRIVALAAVSWALAARQPGRIAGPVLRAGWPCPGLSHDTTLPQALPWSQYTKVYCDTKTQQPALFMSQYSRRLAIHSTYCPPKLQYTSPIAIQFSSLLAIQFFPQPPLF